MVRVTVLCHMPCDMPRAWFGFVSPPVYLHVLQVGCYRLRCVLWVGCYWLGVTG